MTPGEVAFRAFYESFAGTVPDWPPIGPDGAEQAWENAGEAVIDTCMGGPS